MKKLMSLAGLGALSLFLMMGGVKTLHADEPAPGDNNGPGMMEKGHDWGKGGPGGMWKEKLGLTDDQVAKMKELMKKQMTETQPLRDQMKVDMDTLKLKVDAKASDDTIKILLDNLSADKKKLQAKRESFIEQAKSILTPSQQAKFLMSMKGHGRWDRGERGGWCGGDKMRGGCMGKDGKECPMMKGKDGGMAKHKGRMDKDDDDSSPADSKASK